MPLIGILRFRLEALALGTRAWLVEHRQVAYSHALVHRHEPPRSQGTEMGFVCCRPLRVEACFCYIAFAQTWKPPAGHLVGSFTGEGSPHFVQ